MLRVGKVFLNIWVVFHLIAVSLFPFYENTAVKMIQPILKIYMAPLGFENPWSFFAPDPGPPVRLEYEIEGKSYEILKRGVWPPNRNQYLLTDQANRTGRTIEPLFTSPVAVDRMLAPYLCRTHEGAHSVRVSRVLLSTPSPAELIQGKRSLGDDEIKERESIAHVFCDKMSG